MIILEKSIKVIKQIERTHDGLGGYILLNQIALYAKKSVFNIASSGSGKKILIGSIKAPRDIIPEFDMEFDSLTLTQMAKRINIISDKWLLWRIFEFATLQDYHRRIMLSIGSKIITDRNYMHVVGVGDKALVIDIKNCDLSMLIGIQPVIFSNTVSNSDIWRALTNDRFIKLVVINPLRKKEVNAYPIFHIDEPIRQDYNLPEKPLVMSRVLKGQVSDGRLNSLCRSLLKSYMQFEGYEEYKKIYEIEFMQLFKPLITIFDSIYYTNDLGTSKVIRAGNMCLLEQIAKADLYNGITQKELAEKFKVYNIDKEERDTTDKYKEDNVARHAKALLHFGLIKRNNEYPVKYALSDALIDYFEFYSRLIN